MIAPTVGRVVWFYRYFGGGVSEGEYAAIVARVHSNRLVNLMVISEIGATSSELDVPLIQEGEETPNADYCCWMPYQIGQAKKQALTAGLAV